MKRTWNDDCRRHKIDYFRVIILYYIYMLHSVHGHVSVCGHALYRAIHGHRVAIHGHRQLCATALVDHI